jgi:hypothetical protein
LHIALAATFTKGQWAYRFLFWLSFDSRQLRQHSLFLIYQTDLWSKTAFLTDKNGVEKEGFLEVGFFGRVRFLSYYQRRFFGSNHDS